MIDKSSKAVFLKDVPKGATNYDLENLLKGRFGKIDSICIFECPIRLKHFARISFCLENDAKSCFNSYKFKFGKNYLKPVQEPFEISEMIALFEAIQIKRLWKKFRFLEKSASKNDQSLLEGKEAGLDRINSNEFYQKKVKASSKICMNKTSEKIPPSIYRKPRISSVKKEERNWYGVPKEVYEFYRMSSYYPQNLEDQFFPIQPNLKALRKGDQDVMAYRNLETYQKKDVVSKHHLQLIEDCHILYPKNLRLNFR